MTNSDSRLPVWLLALFVAAFAIGTDDFVIAGILPEVAADLDVSVAAAGQLITVFSVTYAIGAPIAAVITARWSRRTVMLTAMALFTVGNVIAAAAPSFAFLLVTRVLLALAAATVSPAAVAMAAAGAPRGKQGRYIGVVGAGLTVSLAAGVPIGTWLGGTFGWRSTMLFVAALALLAMLGMSRLPATGRPPRVSLAEQLTPLRKPAIGMALVTVLIAASGSLMYYEYIAPVAGVMSGVGAQGLALLIAIAGLGGAAGAWVGGKATDRFGPERTIMVSVSCQVATILLTALLAYSTVSVPVTVMAGLVAAWSIAGWAFNPAMYLRLINLSGTASAEVAGLNNSALFGGIAIAGGLGGAVLAAGGAVAVPLTSGLLGLLALTVFAVSFRMFPAPERANVAANP